jgi:hypothetical protein
MQHKLLGSIGGFTMTRSDLTGYAALFGESLTSKVDLLGRLIGDSHYPSLGQYKERLLADAIRGFLPRTVEVGTGFVMFPHADMDPPAGGQFHDPLNNSAFAMSRQCDILIYDVAKYPAIFRDRDFVVIRPEAVRAVIEVKGSLSRREVLSAVRSFHDFALKWRTTQLFYREQFVPLTPKPPLIVMAWSISNDAASRLTITPAGVCKMIAKFYAENVDLDDVDAYPFLRQFLIHNEAEIFGSVQVVKTSRGYADHYGWSAWDGRFIRVAKDGSLERGQDRTIAQLLAVLHMAVAEEDFNRFFSYQEEIKDKNIVAYKYSTSVRAWSDLDVEAIKRINSSTVNRRGTG